MKARAVFSVVALGLTILPAVAVAQSANLRRGQSGDTDEQVLTASGSIGAGYDTSVLLDASEAGVSRSAGPYNSPGSAYSLFGGGLSYALNRAGFGVNAAASSSTRYYQNLSDPYVSSYWLSSGAAYGHDVSKRTHVGFNGTVGYQPFTTFSLFPLLYETPAGQLLAADEAYGAIRTAYLTSSGGANVSHQLSRKTTLLVSYSYQRSDVRDQARYGYESHTVSGRITRNFTKNLGIRLGYGYTEWQGASTQMTRTHNIDAGVDYNRSFSLTRRTTVAFSSGGLLTQYGGFTQYDVTGSATLTHQIGRTWEFRTAYNRNVAFAQAFSAPFLYDSATAALSGAVSRRVAFSASAGAMVGNLGLSRASNSFNTYYATTGVDTKLSSFLVLSVAYSAYHYTFDQAALLPLGFDQNLGRHSVRVTLNASGPLFRRGRRHSATR